MDRIEKWLEQNKEAMLTTLRSWVAVPSVKQPGKPGAPFGEDTANMLDMALRDCEALGMETRNFDHYAGDARIGRIGVDPLGVLAHLDVVPAGDGWQTEPFTPTLEAGRLYGRGTSDDKGPTVAALYAMAAIKACNIPLAREVRLILGCDEESGWEDMSYYVKHCDMPKSGFSPDADYPVINTEKGLIHLSLRGKAASDGLRILSIGAGQRPNVVPGMACALVEGDEALCDKARMLAREMTLSVMAESTGTGVKLTSIGQNGHAAYPQGAKNAIGQLLLMLRALGATGAIKLLADKVGMDYDGQGLNVKCQDEVSGALTCNLGILRLNEENGLYATLDFRYPLLVSGESVIGAVKAALDPLEITVDEHKAPHHVPASSELVTKLLDAYYEETGMPKEALAIGGGTYARCLEQGVAFGAAFPGDEELAHQAGEYITVEALYKNARIFARAILKLAGQSEPVA